jgi:membrane fusion protein, multidrug efflux system
MNMKNFTISFLAISALFAAGCGNRHEHKLGNTESAVRQVTLANVERAPGSVSDEFMGTVISRNRADIESKLQARVEKIDVALGSRVNAGDPLAELDIREYRARVDQAQAMYDQAAQDYDRFEALYEQHAITKQEFDAAKTRKTAAEAALTEAQTYLSYTIVTAPFSGVITEQMVQPGDFVVPGKSLFTLEKERPLRFQVSLPEAKQGQITVGDSVQIIIPSIGTAIKGRIEEFSPGSDPISRTFIAKIGLPDFAGLHPGQFGRLQLSTAGEPTLQIPRGALVKRGQLDLVYAVTRENRAMLRLVRVGREYPDRIEILSGLSENERVVVAGQAGLSDGDSIMEQP